MHNIHPKLRDICIQIPKQINVSISLFFSDKATHVCQEFANSFEILISGLAFQKIYIGSENANCIC